jgi:hypothetical protein
METGQDEKVSERKNFNPSQTVTTNQKLTFCKRARACFRYMSLGAYRTPLYFANKDSYKSATSGILTILLGLIFVISFV